MMLLPQASAAARNSARIAFPHSACPSRPPLQPSAPFRPPHHRDTSLRRRQAMSSDARLQKPPKWTPPEEEDKPPSPAPSLVVEETQAKPEYESPSLKGVVRLAGQNFISKGQLTTYFGHLLHNSRLNVPLEGRALQAVMELVTLGHPKAQSKLAPGVKAVIVGLHPMYVTNCFQLVRSDGSREDFSYRKCVRGMVERFDLFDDPCSPEKPGRVGTLVLQRLLFQGPEGEERAWELYNEMLQSGEANEYHATAMLKRHNSTQQREIVERNAAAGLPPTLVTYTMLMSRLLLEGRRDKAEAVMREMEAAGLEPDHRSHAVFTDPTLGRKRWAEMRRLRKLGEAGAAEAAEIWERVQATGEAEAPQVMIETAPTVAARVELLERYPAVPDALSVALVVAAAMGEGDAATAAAALGAWTDADPPPFASWSRAYRENDLYLLQDLLMEGSAEGAQDAWEAFEELLSEGAGGDDVHWTDTAVALMAAGARGGPSQLEHLNALVHLHAPDVGLDATLWEEVLTSLLPDDYESEAMTGEVTDDWEFSLALKQELLERETAPKTEETKY